MANQNLVVFITGGTGFIGRNLVEQLRDKYKILAPSHQELELLDEEAVSQYLRSHKIDVVIHGAIKPGHRNAKDPTNLIYPNTRIFFNLARNNKYFRKMIWLSSGAVYDMRYYKPKMSEDYFDTHVPQDETGYYKYICAKYAELSPNIIELRPFGVFGKYEDWEIRFISNAICKTLFDLPITIKQNRRFDYLYINDLVKVIEYFIDHETKYKAYNVTPDESIELKILAEKVRSYSGKDLEIKISQPGIGVEYSGSNFRLRSQIPDLQFTDIDVAIAELYEWYKSNRYLINRDALLIDK
ncbi:MAG: NAD-dependent epimerase/dehydratase family protein [Thermodesulfobacteriota bacterium]